MNGSLPVEVVDVIVESEYQGSLYERTLILKTSSNTVRVFEDKGIITEKDCGDVINVNLVGQLASGSVVDNIDNMGISQPENVPKDRSKWHCQLRGKVTEITRGPSGDKCEILLDIGPGTVMTKLHRDDIDGLKKGIPITEGDLLYVEAGRLDIAARS